MNTNHSAGASAPSRPVLPQTATPTTTIPNTGARTIGGGQEAGSEIARIPSAWLLRGARLLEISHGVDVYRLRLTAAGKLILTK